MPLINCKIYLELNWTKNCVIYGNNVYDAADDNTTTNNNNNNNNKNNNNNNKIIILINKNIKYHYSCDESKPSTTSQKSFLFFFCFLRL